LTTFDQPPKRLSWYHLGSLLDAETGCLKYDPVQYSVHGVSNNAVACCWAGLLADGDGGLVLTDLGRTMLADWKAGPEGQAWLANWANDDVDEPAEEVAAPTREPARPCQLDLFSGVAG
jgi:hypothetical protein